VVNEKCIDVIVHFAGKPIVADCDQDPFYAFKANGLGTASVLESARYAKVKKVIVIETDKVYGFQEEIPTNEDAVLNPGSPYEMSKAIAAHFCDFYRKHYDMDVISVRPVNVFGPGDYSFTRIIPAAMRYVADGKGISVYEQAIDMKRDFIYVDDVARMMYLLVTEDTKHGIYNLSTNESISIMELANRVTKILYHPIEPILIKKPGVYPEIPYQSIDGSRFLDEFDFSFTPFDIAIIETYKNYTK
jgi:UDP-glucose 4-epimerase